jgi:hypothetical protein
VVPNFPALHGGPWGYAIIWEIIAAIFFVVPYGAVALAIVLPVNVSDKRIESFARNATRLLSAASEADHVDFTEDLHRSLPRLVEAAAFADKLSNTTAFFDFIHRKELSRAAYASTLLRVIADQMYCETLVRRAPWRAAQMLRELALKHLHTPSAEQFVRELGHQAVLRDDGMMERELGYHGFGTVPLLSESLFSNPFLVLQYNPLHTFFSVSGEIVTPLILKRFNNAAERCYAALLSQHCYHHAQVSYSIQSFYRSTFMRAWSIQKKDEYDPITIEMHWAVRNAIKMANQLLATANTAVYDGLFVNDATAPRADVLETLVEIVYEALAAISNQFKGFDDQFWILAIEAFAQAFDAIGSQPDGMTPFQQRLALKIIKKLEDNMRGLYPAICRVLLACVGPYQHQQGQINQTAFNILKEVMYGQLKRFPQLAATKPNKVVDYLPPNVTYDATTTNLTHSHRGGAYAVTNLLTVSAIPTSLVSPVIRRTMTEAERQAALRAI